MVVKYRKKVIDDAISNRLCEIFTNIGHNYGKMFLFISFYLMTTGGVTIDVIKQYIETRGGK